jgi:hypothetical protein
VTGVGQGQGEVAEPVPGWVAPVFAALAVMTVPWTAFLAATLPVESQTRHYRAAWVGFDLGLILLLLVTAYLAWLGHRRVASTATATATLLVIDAWFDVVTSPAGDVLTALGSAIFVELPLAVLCLWISLHVDRVTARRLRYLARRAERTNRRT